VGVVLERGELLKKVQRWDLLYNYGGG